MNAPGRPMIRTFLPAQALRTSKKTGGLNSRPSCVRGAVCYAVSRLSGLVSAGRVRTTVSKLALRSSREACSARAAALARRRPARDVASLQLCGTLLHAWTCTSGMESPAFTMAASERERFAAGGSVFALYEASGRTYNNDKWQCQPSEGEALSGRSLGVEASRAVPDTPQRTTIARPNALG